MKWLTRWLHGNSGDQNQASDELKSQGYLAYTEWGPDGVRHRDSQLEDVLPQVPLETRRAWIAEFKNVDKEIWNAVRRGITEGKREQFFTEMRSKFPFMNKRALDHAWFLVGYYTMHG